VHNDPPVTVTDPASHLSNSGVVPFQIQNSTTAPPLPNCSASPNPAGVNSQVTVTCTGGTPGDQVTIPHSDCTNKPIPASGNLTCAGKGEDLGSNPPLTVTDPGTGGSSQGSVPLNVMLSGPSAPHDCTVTPNPARQSATVTITCQVDAGTTNTVPNAHCDTVGTTATCTGTGAQLGGNPTMTSTDSVGNSGSSTVPLIVRAAPTAPTCTAAPNPADANATVTITCEVDANTVTTFPQGVICPTTRTTTATTITCTGLASLLGNNPTATSTDDAGNTITATVPLVVNGLPYNNNAVAIPTLSDWSLIALALMLLGLSGAALRRGMRR